jgi:saccharopine dehydrogenase (NADP+, L-glutamate forming)/spermidine synthase
MATKKTARKAKKTAKKPRKVAKKPKKVARKPARKVVRKPKKVARKPARKVVRKPKKVARKPAKKIVRRPIGKPVRKVVRKPAKKIVRRPVGKPAKKAAPPVARAAAPAARPAPTPEGRPPAPPPAPPAPKLRERRVLVLGAGLVVRPLVDYLVRQSGYHVTMATRTVSKARDMIAGRSNAEAVAYDMTQPAQLGSLVGKADLVVSMLPWQHHPVVAKACIERRKHLVTTSYVKDAMRALDADARAAGVILLNEMGLDPGIDHMSAMRVIHGVQREGGSIASFHSYCGGLPAPEASTNPFGYKFSWSPRGVLMAGKNSAVFRRDGQLVEVPAAKLFETYWEVKVDDLGTFEGYPNRDSLSYLGVYGIGSAKTMLRGTLRNPGWCRTMKKIVDLGLLDETPRGDLAGMSLVQFTRSLLGPGADPDIRLALAKRLDVPPDSEVILRLDWLGLLSQDPVPVAKGGNIDVLTAVMHSRMQYGRGERDMIVLRHEFVAEYPGGRKEEITSTLIDFGVPGGDTAMSRTVALPAAIACRLVLEGRIERTGVCIPTEPAIFHPVLDELESLGIHCVEKKTMR